MIPIRPVFRVLYAGLRYRLDTILSDFVADHWLRWFLPATYLPKPKSSSATRLKQALIHLGPIYVKFGQTLSTRRDLLPAEFADELETLQARVPPFDSKVAVDRVEHELGAPLVDLFTSFDQEPLASASLAQVHAATLLDGSEVVVKVIRPDAEDAIHRDMRMIKGVAKFLERVSAIARRLHMIEVVSDYETAILAELDLTQEGKNTTRLRTNFASSELLYAPRVYTHITTKSVLVLERIRGVPVSDLDTLNALGTDVKLLAKRGVETFFTQVFDHNFFHADMHPGNIFVDVSNPKKPSYIAVDCALFGTLSTEDQTFIARNIIAFFNRDYGEIARLHVESGWVPDETKIGEFEELIQELLEPFFEKPLSEISFGQFLLNLFTAARQFEMEVRPQLVLLQKTLLQVEGLGRQLDPNLDLWSTAKPFMERWMQTKYGPLKTIQATLDHAPEIMLELPFLPELLATARRTITKLNYKSAYQHQRINELNANLQRAKRASFARRFVGVLLLGGTAIAWNITGAPPNTFFTSTLLAVIGICGLIFLLSR
ncbi:MAG: 2-polyprenylphenol 6-hydroxylase [Gammaproteobacteria bacterium]|nr:2-polyprenylphenol 6-hydroxylase [Gammaproteobacteria bacterium]